MTDKIKNIVISLMFVLIIILVFIINIIKDDTDISLTERRKLSKFPEITLNSLVEGNFSDSFENYSMDQFINREWFRKLKANFEIKFLNKKDFNGIYEYNNFLIKQEYPLNEKSVLNLSKKINEVKEKYLSNNNIYYSIIPDKNYFIDNEYLKIDYNRMEEILSNNLQNMQYIDIFDDLKLADYYYTDIHWKQESLDKVLEKFANDMNFKKYLTKHFEEVEVLDFKGVYTGQYPLESKTDKIKILINEDIQNAKVYNYETKKESKVYDFTKTNSNDKYDIYLSGASALLEIENSNAKSKKELIVFRDSFASSLIPLFIEGYEKITLVDLRYINLNTLKEYIDFENKEILFLYSTPIINNSYSIR